MEMNGRPCWYLGGLGGADWRAKCHRWVGDREIEGVVNSELTRSLTHSYVQRYIRVSSFFVWIFICWCRGLCQYVPFTHGAGASIPLLRFYTPWKAYKAASYLCFWSEKLQAGSCNRSHPCLLRFYPLYLPLPSFSPSGIRDLWRAYSPRLWVCINNNASCQCE